VRDDAGDEGEECGAGSDLRREKITTSNASQTSAYRRPFMTTQEKRTKINQNAAVVVVLLDPLFLNDESGMMSNVLPA
jgi:hypothetical protein